MSEPLPRVVLALVTYGHQAVLPATLQALQTLDYPAERCSIVLVDNGDGACAAIAAARGIHTILPGSNLGFAGGSNAAVAAGDADIVLLVNPDLRPHPHFLAAIVAPLADAEVGAVGAKLLYPNHTIQHAGGWLEQPRLTAQHWGWAEADDGRWDQARDVEFVTGAALAVRREVWDRLGGLDPTFEPAYYEDVDFCLRLREHGLRVHYEPRAVATHLEAASLGRGSAAYHSLYHRNRLRVLWKHAPDTDLIGGWLPAELAYLRSAEDDIELAALMQAYLWWEAEFLETRRQGDKERGRQSDTRRDTPEAAEKNVVADSGLVAGGVSISTQAAGLPGAWGCPPTLSWLLGEVQRKSRATTIPFRSRLPFVARLRELLSRLVIAEYVRPLTQQQNDFNASAVELLATLVERTERQRRSADAAIACQAMLLAKLLRS